MASVLVRKSDNIVVKDSDLDTIAHDPNDYELIVLGTNPVPPTDDPKKYMKDAGGNIVKRPLTELVHNFDDEKATVIQSHLTTIQADPGLSQATKDAITGIIGALA